MRCLNTSQSANIQSYFKKTRTFSHFAGLLVGSQIVSRVLAVSKKRLCRVRLHWNLETCVCFSRSFLRVAGEEDQGANGRREDKLEEAIMGCHMEMTCKQLICINNLTAWKKTFMYFQSYLELMLICLALDNEMSQKQPRFQDPVLRFCCPCPSHVTTITSSYGGCSPILRFRRQCAVLSFPHFRSSQI